MTLHLGTLAPDFRADSTAGPIAFHAWLGDCWGILFSHPADFTPVCTTELGRAAQLEVEFERRNTRVIAISTDSLVDHMRWVGDIERTQSTRVRFPIVADPTGHIARAYDMIHDEVCDKTTVRSVVFVDPYKKVRATLNYPANTGRSFDEILRLLDSLQLGDRHRVATPADWQAGDDVLIEQSLTDTLELSRTFPEGFRVIRPYLRYAHQPGR